MRHVCTGAALFLMFSVSSAFAEWSNSGTISDLRIYDENVVFGSLSSLSVTDSQAKCGTTSGLGEFGMKLGQTYSNSVLSMMISSEMTGRAVYVYMTGACEQGRPAINGVQIVPK